MFNFTIVVFDGTSPTFYFTNTSGWNTSSSNRSLSSSLRSSLHSPVASYPSGPNILVRTLFSNTLSLRYPSSISSKIIYSLRHLSRRNKSTGKEKGWQLWIMTHWGHFGLANWKCPLNAAVIRFLQLTGGWRPKGKPTSESHYKQYKLKLKSKGDVQLEEAGKRQRLQATHEISGTKYRMGTCRCVGN